MFFLRRYLFITSRISFHLQKLLLSILNEHIAELIFYVRILELE